MKRTVGYISGLASLAALVLIGWSSHAASPSDMRTGVFEGKWCNYPATFSVQRQVGSTWVFYGRVLIKSTKQFDVIRIEQYGNNSLRMIRYLAGDHAGQTQVVQTYPPEEYQYRDTGRYYYQFKSKVAYGGCESTSSILYLNVR